MEQEEPRGTIYVYAKEEEHTELSRVHNIIDDQKSYKYAYNANKGGRLGYICKYTIGNKNYAYMCLTLLEAQMEAKVCT